MEAVLIVSRKLEKEGVMAEFIGRDRKPFTAPIFPKEGDLIYGLTPRFKRILYMRGLAVPVRFPDEIAPRKHLTPDDLKKNAGVRGAGRTKTITKRKVRVQTDLLRYLK